MTEPENDVDLAALAKIANEEHRETQRFVGYTLDHAIKAGDALMLARRAVPAGSWGKWVEQNLEMSRASVCGYLRISTHREELFAARARDEIGASDGIRGALRYLQGFARLPRRAPTPPEILSEAKDLRSLGWSWRRVADELDVSPVALRRNLVPGERGRDNEREARRRREKTAAKKALERERTKNAINKIGGNPAKAYGLVRQLTQVLDAMANDMEDGEQRRAALDALSHAFKVEDELVRALQIARQEPTQLAGRPRSERRSGQQVSRKQVSRGA